MCIVFYIFLCLVILNSSISIAMGYKNKMEVRYEKRNERVVCFDDKDLLPSDIIADILSWLPPRSLTRLQLVCKMWQSIIQGPHFAGKYHDHSAIVCCYSNSSLQPGSKHSVGFVMKSGRKGLLLISKIDDGKFCLWNPAIHHLLELPNPHRDSYGFALSYCSSSRTYKIFSVYKDEGSKEACEVLTPGHDSKEWRHLKSFPYDMARVIDNGHERSVSLVVSGEEVHCIRVITLGTERYREVVTISVGNESISVIRVPKDLLRDWTTVKALDWNGKLGFADIVGENLQVTLLEDHKKQKWCRNKEIMPLPFIKKEKYGEGDLIPLFAENGDIWFWAKDKKVFTYRRNGLITLINYLQHGAFPESYYSYRPTMARFEKMIPDTGLERIRHI